MRVFDTFPLFDIRKYRSRIGAFRSEVTQSSTKIQVRDRRDMDGEPIPFPDPNPALDITPIARRDRYSLFAGFDGDVYRKRTGVDLMDITVIPNTNEIDLPRGSPAPDPEQDIAVLITSPTAALTQLRDDPASVTSQQVADALSYLLKTQFPDLA